MVNLYFRAILDKKDQDCLTLGELREFLTDEQVSDLPEDYLVQVVTSLDSDIVRIDRLIVWSPLDGDGNQ